MGLIALYGSRKAVNDAIMQYALEHTPALVVDCGNCANIHKWFPFYPDADYDHIYVYELELLYRFRDSLLHVRDEARAKECNCIVVTSAAHLFNYHDPVENNELYVHAWELLHEYSKEHTIVVAVDTKAQLTFAKRYATELREVTMGHTVWSQRQNLEHMITELDRHARALRKDEAQLCRELLDIPMRHVGSIAYANSLHTWSFLLLTIALEQEKRIRVLENHAGIPHRRIQAQEQRRLVVENS